MVEMVAMVAKGERCVHERVQVQLVLPNSITKIFRLIPILFSLSKGNCREERSRADHGFAQLSAGFRKAIKQQKDSAVENH